MFDFADDSSIFLADSPHKAIVGANDPVQVVYDAPFRKTEIYDGQVETSAPACSMLDADVTRLGIQYKTALTILKNGVPVGDFTVMGSEPDGMGLTRLTLTNQD